jgi:hypothetical protein
MAEECHPQTMFLNADFETSWMLNSGLHEFPDIFIEYREKHC